MDNKNKNELFERISDDYYIMLLNWAHKKTGNRTDAEDLAQEVLSQIFKSAQKERHIEKLDNFIWKIAHFVWCNYLKKSTVLRSCISIDSFDYDFLSEEDHAEKYAEQEELNDKIKAMRLKVSNLNYLQREIMIMHYIDEQPIKSIAKKLNITEANVKWHLYDTRKKLKKEINEMNNTNFIYRPGKLHMALSGNQGPAPDTHKINESLTKQNICLVCYSAARTPGEIADMLGIAKAYIEYDLEWLVDRQFVKNENSRYSTMFSISSFNFNAKVANLFLENKANFSDAIIDKLIAKQNKIKALGFYGSDKPMEKLLWLLIYLFINSVGNRVMYLENRYPMPERPIMPDGGQYFPLGFDQSDLNEDSLNSGFLNEKYKAIGKWALNGAMGHSIDDVAMRWYGLYNAGEHTIAKLFEPEPDQKYKLLSQTLNKDFNLNYANDNEREMISEMISYGWLSKNGDEITHNFSVFNDEQYNALEDIFGEIYEEMKDNIYEMFEKIKKFCRADLPEHLNFYLNYHIYMAFYFANLFTTGFAYYDGKLYDPKDDVECGLLTLQVITGQSKYNKK